MAPRRASLAVVATIGLLGGARLIADDGKVDQAKAAAQPPPASSAGAKPERAASPETLKGALRSAIEMIRSLADEAAREERQLRFPSPTSFATRFSKEMQADVLRAIGRAQARVGDLPAARATWQSTLDVAAGISGPDASIERAPILIGIAEAQLEAGERDEARFTIRQALQAARSVQRESPFGLALPPGMAFGHDPVIRKADLLQRIARVQAKAGETSNAQESLRQAIETAGSIKDPANRVQELAEIAGGAPKDQAGAVWAKALDFAMAQAEYPRAQGVAAILRARIKAGQIDPALAAIADRLRGDLQTYGLWVFADAVASSDATIPAEVMDRAARLAQKAEYDRQSKKRKVYQRIAEAEARLGAYESAYRIVGDLQPAGNAQNFRATLARVEIMAAVAQAQLKANHREAARDTVNAAMELIAPMADENTASVFPIARLAYTLAGAGEVRGALEMAESVSLALPKADLLADIATVQARAGQDAAARETLRRAIEAGRRAPNDATWGLAANLPGVEPMTPVHSSIAQAQARIGDLDAAFKTIAEMGTASFATFARKEVIEQIVNMRLEVDDIAGARRAADLITPADVMHQDDRANFLERIARRQARAHDPTTILDWARKEATPRPKLQWLRGLADGIADRFEPQNKPSQPVASPAGSHAPGP